MLVQGPLLPAVVRWAQASRWYLKRRNSARPQLAIAAAAVPAVDEVAHELRTSAEVHGRVADEYRSHLSVIQALKGGSVPETTNAITSRRSAAAEPYSTGNAKHFWGSRLAGTVDDSVARRLQTRLDVEEQRLTGVETYD